VIFILNNQYFGHGDNELGSKLMGAFLRKLWAKDELPETIICYNSAVKLLSNESLVLDALIGLSEKGVEIIGCGTCIDFYELGNAIKVGRRTDMVEIVDLISKAEKVVTL